MAITSGTRSPLERTARMEVVEKIAVPESHIAFANEVAAVADKYGMDSFTLTYKPRWHGGEEWDRRVTGTAKISFSASDGRGRPCRCLGITFDACITHIIESNPESSN